MLFPNSCRCSVGGETIRLSSRSSSSIPVLGTSFFFFPFFFLHGRWCPMYRLVQIERQKLCPREFLTPFFRVRPRNFAHIFWKAVSKTRRGGIFNLGFRCRDIRVLTPPGSSTPAGTPNNRPPRQKIQKPPSSSFR